MMVSGHIFFDPNPVSTEPYAMPRCNSDILNKLSSIIIAVAGILDYSGQIRIYLVIVLCFFFTTQIVSSLKSPQYTKSSSRVFFGIADSLRLSIYLGVILNYYLNKSKSTIHIVVYVLAFAAGIHLMVTLVKAKIVDKTLTKSLKLMTDKD
jgi:PAS domain-containing protein